MFCDKNSRLYEPLKLCEKLLESFAVVFQKQNEIAFTGLKYGILIIRPASENYYYSGNLAFTYLFVSLHPRFGGLLSKILQIYVAFLEKPNNMCYLFNIKILIPISGTVIRSK